MYFIKNNYKKIIIFTLLFMFTFSYCSTTYLLKDLSDKVKPFGVVKADTLSPTLNTQYDLNNKALITLALIVAGKTYNNTYNLENDVIGFSNYLVSKSYDVGSDLLSTGIKVSEQLMSYAKDFLSLPTVSQPMTSTNVSSTENYVFYNFSVPSSGSYTLSYHAEVCNVEYGVNIFSSSGSCLSSDGTVIRTNGTNVDKTVILTVPVGVNSLQIRLVKTAYYYDIVNNPPVFTYTIKPNFYTDSSVYNPTVGTSTGSVSLNLDKVKSTTDLLNTAYNPVTKTLDRTVSGVMDSVGLLETPVETPVEEPVETPILQGLWDWLKGILQSILDAILSIPIVLQGIGDLLKTLISDLVNALGGLLQNMFVPNNDFWQNNFNDLRNIMRQKFPHNLDMLDQLKLDGDEFNDITITGYMGTGTSTILSAKFIKANINWIRMVTSMFWIFLLIVYVYNQVYFLIRGTYPIFKQEVRK